MRRAFARIAGSRSRQSRNSAIGPGAELELEDWGRAVLGHIIGEGGMGVVYRGWLYYNPAGRFANTPPHPIAVKLLHPQLQGKARARKLFMREATALARLSHPNIVHFFGLTDFDGQLALVMELVHGESLSELIQRVRVESRRGPLPALPLAHAWHYFAQLLGALAAIHALGILHRDIKSSNVLVRGDGVIKVTDFGIAQVPAEEARNTGGMAPGTGAYMSPEQVLNQPLDPRSDLYSAAIVLYEMLAGVTPFDAPDRSELMVRTAQVDEAPAPLSSVLRQAPPVLDLLMARALAKDPPSATARASSWARPSATRSVSRRARAGRSNEAASRRRQDHVRARAARQPRSRRSVQQAMFSRGHRHHGRLSQVRAA